MPCKALLKDAIAASLDLYKVMIPVIIIVKLLQELDMVQYLAIPLEPVMGMAGLPAEMGLVWATSIIVNLYSGLIVYISMVPTMEPAFGCTNHNTGNDDAYRPTLYLSNARLHKNAVFP